MTETGERYFPRYQTLVGDVEDALNGANSSADRIEGHLRIKCPTTLTILNFGEIMTEFQIRQSRHQHRDRADRPLGQPGRGRFRHRDRRDAGVLRERDRRTAVALSARAVRRTLLSGRARRAETSDRPDRSRLPDVSDHGIDLVVRKSPRGPINVDVRSRFSANDSQVLHGAACRGLGIATMARYIARPAIEPGELKTLLPDFPVPELWLKALVPPTR